MATVKITFNADPEILDAATELREGLQREKFGTTVYRAIEQEYHRVCSILVEQVILDQRVPDPDDIPF